MDLVSGRVLFPQASINGAAYCPQDPWIVNRSIRANILLGLPFDSRRYKAVLDAVALPPDLALLGKGDRTLAGEKGSRLSGGQKQRVALARALYSEAMYVLLDDCLSAVDSRTASHIFFAGLTGPLMKNRTCILATHHTKLALPHASYAVFLDGGRVSGHGTPRELVLAGLIDPDILAGQEKAPPAPDRDLDGNAASPVLGSSHRPWTPSTEGLQSSGEPSVGAGQEYKESKHEGAIPRPILRNYLRSMGAGWYWVLVLIGFVLQQLTALGTKPLDQGVVSPVRHRGLYYDPGEPARIIVQGQRSVLSRDLHIDRRRIYARVLCPRRHHILRLSQGFFAHL